MVTFLKPALDLASRIQMCWSVRGGKKQGNEFQEMFPDGGSYLIYRFSRSGCRMAYLGPLTGKASVEMDGASDYFCVRFRAGQAPRLADIRPPDLVDQRLELDKIGDVKIGALADRFLGMPDTASRQAAMEALLRKLPPLVEDPTCRKAALVVETRGGRLKVGELADGFSLHPRGLERRFRAQLGLSPKLLARLARLWRLLHRLRDGGFGNLAGLAFECGYTDQSHMIRDFKEFTGHLPGRKSPGRPGN
jgi:AraC-like DNA-binding protein